MDSQVWGDEGDPEALSVKQLYLSLPCEVDSKFSELNLNQKPKKVEDVPEDESISDDIPSSPGLPSSVRRVAPIYTIEHVLSHSELNANTMFIFDIGTFSLRVWIRCSLSHSFFLKF